MSKRNKCQSNYNKFPVVKKKNYDKCLQRIRSTLHMKDKCCMRQNVISWWPYLLPPLSLFTRDFTTMFSRKNVIMNLTYPTYSKIGGQALHITNSDHERSQKLHQFMPQMMAIWLLTDDGNVSDFQQPYPVQNYRSRTSRVLSLKQGSMYHSLAVGHWIWMLPLIDNDVTSHELSYMQKPPSKGLPPSKGFAKGNSLLNTLSMPKKKEDTSN